ncbi:unnamed protein product [Cladocopium goreaui]|uniref:Uncharacterized protein n=1 Tax=Cladocopium goreaui TaxID=2562237 RepID=A0A9P1D3S5_9DINO|nr:unnamed protein product [Cladocopium goreaui]
MEGMNPEIQGQGQVPLCDLGFGPLSCFVTMKPFSCDYLAPIKTRIPRDDAVQNAGTNSSVEVSEVIETNDNQLPKAATSSKLETKVSGLKKRTFPSPKGKKFLDDATSLQSFSSGGSSPSWSRKWNSPKAMPARTLAGYKPDASREWASGPLGPLEERTSKVSKQSDEEDRQRLLDAWSSGRLIEAKRLVQKSQNMKRRFHEILDENDLEVIHRVDASFSHSLDELEQKAGTGWMKDRDEAQDLDMAFRLSKDLLQAVASTVCMGCDIVQALDGLLEYVQQHEHNDDLEVQQLNNELEQDSLLRVFRSGHGRTEDNILHCSWLDALDEPLGALWLSSYTYKHRNPKFRGVRLPPPKSGSVRLSFWRSSFAIAPHKDLKRGQKAVRITYALARRPSSAACIFPSIMHREVGKMLTSFKEFLRDRAVQKEHVSSSSIYDCIRRHAAERAANPQREVQEVSFQELASLLPEDWADYHDPAHVNDYNNLKDFE